MNIESHDLFAKHYVPMAQAHLEVGRALDAETVQVQPSRDLSADLWRLKATGLLPIGSAEFVGRGSMGMGFEARKQAAAIGASVVLFRLTPAKIKTIRRGPDGAIDLEPVLADPPASMSSRSYYVVQSFFLAKAPSNEA